MSKMIIITAPSGAGKTTIVEKLLNKFDNLAFSISATTRAKRPHEKDGVDYYFISHEEFKKRIANGDFAEWEEVYENQFYGTLKSEIERIWALDKHIIFDIEVKGAQNLKKIYGDQALAIFINPPSLEVLIERLKNRKTENEKSLKKRIARAKKELEYVNKFDRVVVNDILDKAVENTEKILNTFLEKQTHTN
jgi:guanylate kinase